MHLLQLPRSRQDSMTQALLKQTRLETRLSQRTRDKRWFTFENCCGNGSDWESSYAAVRFFREKFEPEKNVLHDAIATACVEAEDTLGLADGKACKPVAKCGSCAMQPDLDVLFGDAQRL